jgi:hypothetical protein
MSDTYRVLGVDLASANWAANGTALLEFDVTNQTFVSAAGGLISWASEPLTSENLARQIDNYAREHGVCAVSLDGPQGWRAPSTAPELPGVGRRCEYESRTQGKTGVFPQTYPITQQPWIQFCTEVFARLLDHVDVRLAEGEAPLAAPESGYLLLEAFPTAAWRSSGLAVLPAKSKKPDLQPFVAALRAAYRLPLDDGSITSHDDLQALVTALPAVAVMGGPAIALRTGVRSITTSDDGGRTLRLEGYIWNVRPIGQPMSPEPIRKTSGSSSTSEGPALRVTRKVLEQVNRSGASQMQLAARSLPHATKASPIAVTIEHDGAEHRLMVGDTHAIWRSHQDATTLKSFEALFALLADAPGEWIAVSMEEPGGRRDSARWEFYPTAVIEPADAAGRKKPAKYVGRTTRMGVEQYQDYTLYINDDRDGRKGRHLSDEQLCADWQHEFPDAVPFTAFHVVGVRRDFIKGTDGPTGSHHGVRDAAGDVVGGASSQKH